MRGEMHSEQMLKWVCLLLAKLMALFLTCGTDVFNHNCVPKAIKMSLRLSEK